MSAQVLSNPHDAAQALQVIVDNSNNIVFFGGAGVSTASGIPDFRSPDGIYHQRFAYPPETILSHNFYETHTKEFYDFYREKMIALWAQPNQAHKKLAELEQPGKLSAVITQNIDGLHQAAGSRNVFELHGSVHRNVCRVCAATYSAEWVMEHTGVPVCERCGGDIKPDVVLYGEALAEQVLFGAMQAIQACDTLIIGGTSLVVYPAAGLIQYFSGNTLVMCNKEPTAQDASADLICACDIAQAFAF